MVKGQAWRATSRVPICLCCIIAGLHFLVAAQNASEDNTHCMTPWITARIPKCAYLFQPNSRDPGFLFQFASGGMFKRFVLVYKASRQGPPSFVGAIGTSYQKHLDFVARQSEQDNVGSNCRSRVPIAVRLLQTAA